MAWVLARDEARESTDSSGRWVIGYPIPDEAPAVTALTASPGPIWIEGLDFYANATYVWFYRDPLQDAVEVAKQFPDQDAAVVWAVAASVPDPTVRAAIGSYEALTLACVTAYDAPRFTVAADLTVLTMLDDGRWVVATGSEAFLLDTGVSPATRLVVGLSVRRGDPVSDAWHLVRLGPGPPGQRVAVGATALPPTVLGPLVWRDAETAVVVDTVSSRTRARFALGGAGSDVTAFWAAAHDAAVAGRTSMADLLDTRVTRFGEPTAANLPATVNPAKILCQRIVGGCGYMVVTNPDSYGPNALSAANRATQLAAAAGTGCGVFEFEGGVPDLAAVLP